MQIELDENATNVSIVAIIVTAILILVLGLVYAYNARVKLMMENGYNEVTLQGNSNTYYQKK